MGLEIGEDSLNVLLGSNQDFRNSVFLSLVPRHSSREVLDPVH